MLSTNLNKTLEYLSIIPQRFIAQTRKILSIKVKVRKRKIQLVKEYI